MYFETMLHNRDDQRKRDGRGKELRQANVTIRLWNYQIRWRTTADDVINADMYREEMC